MKIRVFPRERKVLVTLPYACWLLCRPEGSLVRPLRIPRRPRWEAGTSKEEQEGAETRSFLEWRAAIAM